MREEIGNRLQIDPGQLTIGQLLQDREAARIEIERLKRELDSLRSKVAARAPENPVSAGKKDQPKYVGNVLIGIGDLCKQIGVSRTTIYRWINTGTFPAAVRISPGAVRWRSEDVEQWRTSLQASS
jgi:prophage regulatory protein